jgi:hypothetical protein
MEKIQKRYSFNGEIKKQILKDIEKEYSLKRNIRGPMSPSPNIFISKLKLRMSCYYNNLYNSKNLGLK